MDNQNDIRSEISTLETEVRSVIGLLSTRLNFYYLLIGGVSSISLKNNLASLFQVSGIGLIIGLAMLVHSTLMYQSIVGLRRRRRYLLKNFLSAEMLGKKPKYYEKGIRGIINVFWRGAEPVLVTINSIFFAIMLYAINEKLSCIKSSICLYLMLLLGIIVIILIQILVVKLYMKNVNDDY